MNEFGVLEMIAEGEVTNGSTVTPDPVKPTGTGGGRCLTLLYNGVP